MTIEEPYTCAIEEFSSSGDGLYPVKISGDGTIAVTRENFLSPRDPQRSHVSFDYEVQAYQWDMNSLSWREHGKPIKDEISDEPYWSMGLSADGSVLALNSDGTCYEDHLRFFRFENDWQQIGSTLHGFEMPEKSLSGDGNSVIVDDEEVYEWNSSDWKPKGQSVPDHGWGCRALSFNGSVMASGAQVYQYSNGWIPMGEPAMDLKNPNNNRVIKAVALSPDGGRLAILMLNHSPLNFSRMSEGRIHVFEFDGTAWLPLGQVLRLADPQHRFWDMAFSGTILTYHSCPNYDWWESVGPQGHYMRVFHLQGKRWAEIEGDRWNGHFVSDAAVANENMLSFLSTTEQGVSTVYRVACQHTSEAIPSQNNWLRFVNLMIPLMILSLIFQRMIRQPPKSHSEVELAEFEVTRLN